MSYRYNDGSDGCGCLIGGIILLGIIFIAIYYLLQLAFLVCILFAIGASIYGIVMGIKNFLQTVVNAHKTADLDRYESTIKYKTEPIKILKPFYELQPAKLLYIYDAGWYVMAYVSKNVWQPTRDDASKVFDWAKDRLRDGSYKFFKGWIETAWASLLYASGIGAFIGGAVFFVAAFTIVVIFLTLQFIFLITGVIGASVVMSILGVGNYLFGKFYGIYFRCPNCHHQMKIPTYICRKCNQEHSRLWPSIYGVFYHTCRHNLSSGDVCNSSLPTLTILNRDKLLAKKCPNCNYRLQGVGGTNAHIPIVGSPNSGKSHYIAMATKKLIEDYAPNHNLDIHLPNEKHRENYDINVGKLNNGQKLNKTATREAGADAFNLKISRTNQAISNLLYVYDTAGEIITTDSGSEGETYFKYVHGVLLIIDPFSIRQVYENYKKDLNQQAGNIASSNQSLNDIYGRVLSLFETQIRSVKNNKFSQPIAVIVTKTDICDLEQKIGSYAAREYMAKNSEIANEQDAINILVEEFLNEYGEGNFLRNLRSYFKNIRFFSCSAFGFAHAEQNINGLTSFDGVRVLDPMLWLMEQTKTLPNKASLGAKIFRSKIFVNYGLTAITSTFMVAALGSLGYGGYSFLRWSLKQFQSSSVSDDQRVTQEELLPSLESNNKQVSNGNLTYPRIDISQSAVAFYDKEISSELVKVLVSYSPNESTPLTPATIRYQIFYNNKRYVDSETDFNYTFGSIYLQNLDNDGIPEVITEIFTGGAHCCTEITVYSWQDNEFLESSLTLDGGGSDELFRDFDNDGNSELIIQDNKFLYAFSSYADSFAPTLILSFKNGRFEDTTRSHVQELRTREKEMYQLFMQLREHGGLVNGVLAGYVAQKILLGEYEDGWKFMLENYDPSSDWGLKKYGENGKVVAQYRDFPTALEAFLEKLGYLDGLEKLER